MLRDDARQPRPGHALDADSRVGRSRHALTIELPLVALCLLRTSVAFAAPTKADSARALEEQGEFAEALAAYVDCASDPAEDQRYCAARAAVLGPQRSDGFAGWGVVASVRRDYRTLGHEAAVARVKAALDASPDGPAAPDMRLWLANELTAHGSAAAAAARAAVLEDENALPATKAALRSRERRLAQTARQNLVAAALGAVASIWAIAVVGTRLRRDVAREPAEPMSAGAVAGGLLLLAVLPAAMAWTWGASGWPWFLATGSAGVLGARLAPGLPIWLAVPGTIACVGLGAWAANWFTSLGIG